MSVRVTVVVRTKDRPGFLLRALNDVLAQTYDAWKLVVVNDGGDRAVVDTVVAASAASDRVTVLDTSLPGGRCAAANAGIREADGEFVVLHDDDDRWAPEFLARTVGWLDAHPEDLGVMVATAIVYEQREGSEWVEVDQVPFWRGMERISLVELLEINRAVPISFLYRRSLHQEVGWYDETLEAVEDWDFYLRVVPRFPIGFIGGKALAFWTQRPMARGNAANSMVGLAGLHTRDDRVVRDRELADWISRNGLGLPLYLAHLHVEELSEMRRIVVEELDARRPIWRRLQNLRRRFGRGPQQ